MEIKLTATVKKVYSVIDCEGETLDKVKEQLRIDFDDLAIGMAICGCSLTEVGK